MIAFDRYGHTSLGSCLKTKRTSAGSQRWLWPMTSWRRGTAVWIKVLGIAFAITWRRWVWRVQYQWVSKRMKYEVMSAMSVKCAVSWFADFAGRRNVGVLNFWIFFPNQEQQLPAEALLPGGPLSHVAGASGMDIPTFPFPCVILSVDILFFGKVRLLMMRKLINAQIECNFARAASQRQLLPQFLESAWIPESKFQIEWIQYWQWVTASLKELESRPLRVTRGRGQGIPAMVETSAKNITDQSPTVTSLTCFLFIRISTSYDMYKLEVRSVCVRSGRHSASVTVTGNCQLSQRLRLASSFWQSFRRNISGPDWQQRPYALKIRTAVCRILKANSE